MRIEMLLVGDELLTGELDPYPVRIVEGIRGRGASVSRMTVVPDLMAEIVAELDGSCSRHADLLLVTGGLGPTLDDVTRHALAAFLGRELVIDPGARERMEESLLRKHGGRPGPSSAALLMAMVPEGAEALLNPVGAACGIRARADGTTIVCLPGFPKEMWAMFELHVLPNIVGDGLAERRLRVMRGESAMEPIFRAVAREFQVRIASLPKEDWRSQGNEVVIRGPEEEVGRAAARLLELVGEDEREEY